MRRGENEGAHMTYAHIIDNAIDAVGRLPRGADADGQWLQPLTEDNAHLARWFPVVDTPRPADTDTVTHDRTVVLVADVPTVVWVERPWTPEELAARQADTNRRTIDQAITNALAELQAIVDAPAVATVPAGTLTTAQLSNGMRAMRDSVQQNRAALQRVSATLRHTIRLARGDYDGVD
jgi:hypothetical protein